jgi:arginase family enzyme
LRAGRRGARRRSARAPRDAVRRLSPAAERERLERSAIRVVEWLDGRPQSDVGRVIEELSRQVDEVYVHVDLDALDPEVAPGIVDAPVPGGLSLSDLEDALEAVTARFRVRGRDDLQPGARS